MDIKIFENFDIDNEECKGFRNKFISSTECAPMLNIGKWASAFKLWHIKNGTLQDDFEENEDVMWGKLMEPVIGQGFSILHNCTVEPYKHYHYCEEFGIGASYDFVITSGMLKGYILETKKMRSFAMSEWEEGIPYQYQMQGLMQMLLKPEAKGVIFAGLVDGGKLETWSMTPNEKMFDLIKKKSKSFWESITLGHEPSFDVDDSDSLKNLFRESDGEIIESDEEIERICENLTNMQELAKNTAKDIDFAKAMLRKCTKAAKVKLVDGRTLDMVEEPEKQGEEITEADAYLIASRMIGTFKGAKKANRRCQFRGKVKA